MMKILLICLRERGIYDIDTHLRMEGFIETEFSWSSGLLRGVMNGRSILKFSQSVLKNLLKVETVMGELRVRLHNILIV